MVGVVSDDAVDKLMVRCGDRLMPSKVWTRYQAKRQERRKKGPRIGLGPEMWGLGFPIRAPPKRRKFGMIRVWRIAPLTTVITNNSKSVIPSPTATYTLISKMIQESFIPITKLISISQRGCVYLTRRFSGRPAKKYSRIAAVFFGASERFPEKPNLFPSTVYHQLE
jgi:hypothetical protein